MFNLFKKATETATNYREQLNSKLNNLQSGQIEVSFDDEPPFRLKKGEKYITSAKTVLGTYKRDGGIAFGALTTRIRLAKGIFFRGGAGQVGMSKSWVFDNPGVIHFTTDRIVFDGEVSNKTMQWHKVIGLSVSDDGTQLLVDRDNGADCLFAFDTPVAMEQMFTIALYGKGLVKQAA